MRTCRKCGCTDALACVTNEGPCYWVDDDLCSACLVHVDDINPKNKNRRETAKELLAHRSSAAQSAANRHNKKSKPTNIMNNLTITRLSLLQVLDKINSVVDMPAESAGEPKGDKPKKRPVFPILENILVEVTESGTATIVGTDLGMTVIGTIQVTGDSECKFLLPFGFIYGICKLMTDDDLELQVLKKTVVLKTKGNNIDIEASGEVGDFPKVPVFPVEHRVNVTGDIIGAMNKALVTADTNNLRPAMCKVLAKVEKDAVIVASTNGTTLFEKSFPLDRTDDEQKNVADLLLNKSIVKALNGVTASSLSWNASHLGIQVDNISMIATLQDEKYPNYKAVMPAADANLTLDRLDLIREMKKLELTGQSAMIFLKKEIGFLVIESEDSQHNRKILVRVPGDYGGQCERVKIQPGNLLKILSQVDCEEISFAITAANKGILITSEEEQQYRGLLMPIA
jgi:DNA polymerase III sliding clamp (beta) subunit (PCNA family)